MQVNMLEAKNQLSRLVKAAQAGEEVIIANHGVPAARLVAVESAEPALSLAAELSGLRKLLSEQDGELLTPARLNRANDFVTALRDEHAAG